MEITLDPLPWDSEDIQILRSFLETRTGSRLLPKIVEQVPTLLAKGDTNEVLIRSGLVLGSQSAIRTLLSLARPEPNSPEQESNHYPALTDDAQWNDGQKIKSN